MLEVMSGPRKPEHMSDEDWAPLAEAMREDRAAVSLMQRSDRRKHLRALRQWRCLSLSKRQVYLRLAAPIALLGGSLVSAEVATGYHAARESAEVSAEAATTKDLLTEATAMAGQIATRVAADPFARSVPGGSGYASDPSDDPDALHLVENYIAQTSQGEIELQYSSGDRAVQILLQVGDSGARRLSHDVWDVGQRSQFPADVVAALEDSNSLRLRSIEVETKEEPPLVAIATSGQELAAYSPGDQDKYRGSMQKMEKITDVLRAATAALSAVPSRPVVAHTS